MFSFKNILSNYTAPSFFPSAGSSSAAAFESGSGDQSFFDAQCTSGQSEFGAAYYPKRSGANRPASDVEPNVGLAIRTPKNNHATDADGPAQRFAPAS